MIDGTYTVSMDLPVGKKTGKLHLVRAGSQVTGDISAAGHHLAVAGEVTGETPDAATLRMEGSVAVLFRTIAFTAEAQVTSAGEVSGTAMTSMDDFEFQGHRTA